MYVFIAGELPCIICAYSGTVYNSTYTFSVTDVPERCKGVLYGGYIINTASMADSDKSNLFCITLSVYSIVENMMFSNVNFASKKCIENKQH